ncbi:MAG: pentapeptide repeat-containing protein [Anaerolineales bacterium]|nr:pentapeptide repeat-containing protein [Anaerolineales bacterium]
MTLPIFQEMPTLNFHAESDANFRDAVFANTVTFENAFIGRDANFQGTQFKGTASFPYLTVERFADFSGAVFSEEFLFYYTLAGYPYFEGTVF